MIQETEMGLTGAQPDAKREKKSIYNEQPTVHRRNHENILGAVTLDSIAIRSLFFCSSNLNICHCATHMKCFLELIIFVGSLFVFFSLVFLFIVIVFFRYLSLSFSSGLACTATLAPFRSLAFHKCKMFALFYFRFEF